MKQKTYRNKTHYRNAVQRGGVVAKKPPKRGPRRNLELGAGCIGTAMVHTPWVMPDYLEIGPKEYAAWLKLVGSTNVASYLGIPIKRTRRPGMRLVWDK